MTDYNIYLTAEQTGLPFTVEKNGMNNFRGKFNGGSMVTPLTVSDIINIHLLVELKLNTITNEYRPYCRNREHG
jgi:hypothetical protein